MGNLHVGRYECRFGQPHDLEPVGETARLKVERCKNCPATFRWQKGYKGRIANVAYLAAHARNYAQKGGATHRLFMRLYEPEKCTIILSNV